MSDVEFTFGRFAIQDPTIGDDLLLNHTSLGGYVLHALGHGAPRELGQFRTIAETWTAIDALDAPSGPAPRAGFRRRRRPAA